MSRPFRNFPHSLCLTACLLVLSSCCLFPDRLLFSTPRSLHFGPLPPGLQFQEILFPSGELRLYGWYLPGGPASPLILYFHGTGTNIADEVNVLLQLRQQLKVSVFAFDYRGFGGSGGHPSVEGTFADARAALAFLRQRGWAPQRMIYYGHSLGAAVALQLALEEPPAALVLESPFTSLVDLIVWHNPLADGLLPWMIPNHYDNLAKISGLQSPLLLIHGADDAKVPPVMAQRLFARAPGPKSLLLIAGGDHEAPRQADRTAYWSAWSRFLAVGDTEPGRITGLPAIRPE